MALSSLGRLEYNGVNFNGPFMLTRGVRSHPVMDSSNRTKSYTVHEVTAKLTLTGRPTDAAVLAARRALTTPGRPLRYQDKGFGPLALNVGGAQDVVWGPTPRELSFRPLGGGNACELVWSVSVALVDCDGENELRAGGGGAAFDGLEMNFAAAFDVDDAGYTTRTLTVSLKVPGVRAGRDGKQLALTADQYRELLAPPQVPGFRRRYGPWQIDEAKTHLSGEVIDVELGANYPPPWVANLEASHTVSSNVMGLATWMGTVSATYELIKAAPSYADPVKHFLGVIVRDRLAATAAAVGKNANAIIPLGLEMTEPEVYGRRKASFRFTYSFNQQLKDILGATGLWRIVPGSDWKLWSASMAAGPANPRGFAQMILNPGDDAIYDSCGGQTPPIFQSGGSPVPAPPVGPSVVGRLPPDPGLGRNELIGMIPGVEPTPETSWWFYECWLWVEVDAGTIPVRPLPVAKPKRPLQQLLDNPFLRANPAAQAFDALAGGFPLGGRGGNPFEPPPRGGKLDVQQRVYPTTYVYLRGRCFRHGFPVPIPQLVALDGATPILACRLDRGEGFGHGVVMQTGAAPLYGAQWNLRYHVPDVPADWFPPLPPNPILARRNANLAT